MIIAFARVNVASKSMTKVGVIAFSLIAGPAIYWAKFPLRENLREISIRNESITLARDESFQSHFARRAK
jgi:hypothetical protein